MARRPTKRLAKEVNPETAMALFRIAHFRKNSSNALIGGECILSFMRRTTGVGTCRTRGKMRSSTLSSRRKHLHHWFKSLAGGFRCGCEAWRCEFAEQSKQCDSAAEQGRRYCIAHMASKT